MSAFQSAYATLYPFAVICMALAASVVTIISGGVFWIRFTFLKPIEGSDDCWVGAILAGGFVFAGCCLAAMIELKIGAWVADIGCG